MPEPCDNCENPKKGNFIKTEGTPARCILCHKVVKGTVVTEDERFERAWRAVVEFFPDALLIARSTGSGRYVRATDDTWALGAAHRYVSQVRDCDRITVEDAAAKQAGEGE